MMEQVRSIQKSLPADTILFFRLGDFYEMFFEDAVRASEILQITLTGRDGGPAGRVPMCGIPYHAFSQYVRILLDRNLKVAICEQIGDPQRSQGLLERKVTRIITPATFLDEEAKSARSEYIAAVACCGPARVAIAALDLSTGEFLVREMERDRLPSELALLQPREVVLPNELAQDPHLAAFVREGLRAAVTSYEGWVFEPAEGIRLLQETFSLGSARAVPLADQPLAAGAAGAVLYYLRDHLHLALEHLRPPVLAQSQDGMTLDRQTLRSLELVSSSTGEKRAATLLEVIDRTLTPMGSRILRHWITHPLVSLGSIRRRQEGTAELVEHPRSAQEIRSLCKGVRDIERTLSRLNYGVANARDLLQLRFFLQKVPALQEVLAPCRSGILQELRGEIASFDPLEELIGRAIPEAPPLTVKDGGIILDGFSAELDELRLLAAQGRSWLLEFERRQIARTGIKSLKVRYNQVFGYSIEVSRSNLHLVPPEYTRRQTLANAERFVVPELTQWDERISGAQEKIKGLEYELFQKIRSQLLERLSGLQETARAVGTLDAVAALATAAVQNRWTRPELTDSLELQIRGGRHPVVESMLPAGQFVENDLFLDGEGHQMVILTGPNMAGKSTYIRQAALIVLLAQIGSFVPAQSARIGWVDRIFTRIGARDDLAHGESTFMVEMTEMAQILAAATRRSLVILDEVGRGTSTFDGVSLAWAICEHLVQGPARPRTLFATHYHELIRLEEEFPAIKNCTMAVRDNGDGVIFLRKVTPGGSDRSYGIHVAQLAGIPPKVTGRAEEILQVLEKENTQATRIIEGLAPDGQKSGRMESAVAPKADTAAEAVLRDLAAVEPEKLTPLDALAKLAEWNRRLREEPQDGRPVR